jgi:catechol 2,3-dioxygenase-like lactoylglutathione lyase family enzyme
MIKKLEHMALSVSDIQQSLAFYRDLLGFELVRELDCAPDSKLGEVVGMPGCAAKIAHLMCGETMLELFEYSDPRGTPTAKSLRQADHAFVHIGLQSSDVRGDHKDLQSKGVRFISEPVEFRPEVWIVYFYGPDGEVLEMRETPSGDTRS